MTCKTNPDDHHLIGPALFTVAKHSYCPAPNVPHAYHKGGIVSYRHYILLPSGDVSRAPFIAFNLASKAMFSVWANLGCPHPSLFSRVWYDEKLILRLKYLAKVHHISIRNLDALIVMERITRK